MTPSPARLPAPSDPGLQPGDRLGDFQLLFLVGTGGMGRVWAARRSVGVGANQIVAVKTGLGEGGGTAEFRRLFVDEARIAALIEHPNVCGIYELGEDRGHLFLAMEWSDGATLREVLDAAPGARIDYPVALRIVAHVCAGLHAAHELVGEDGELLHVVHRDVSPQNVLISSKGHVKVADFGVAKARGQLHRPTETGQVKGKLSYMAPEQVTSSKIDRRADIFAIGCVLYEATVGRRPYQGGDALTTLYQLLERETIPPTEIDPSYPKDLEAIVLRALAKDPDERHATAAELERELETWLTSRRLVVTEEDVGRFVVEHLSEGINRKHALLGTTMAQLDARRPVDESTLTAPGISTNDAAVVSLEQNATPSSTQRADIRPGVAPTAPRDRNLVTWLAAGAIGLVVVIAGLTVSRLREPSASQPREPAAAPQVSPSGAPEPADSAPAAPRLVVLTVRADPPSATLELDGGPPGPNPLVLNVPADGSNHVVIARAAGFAVATQRIAYDGAKDVLITLAPSGAQPPSGPRPPVAGTAPSTTARVPGHPPSVSTTPVRPLDQTNPYAKGQR